VLSATLTSLAWDGSASARPSSAGHARADLAVDVRADPTELPVAGGQVQVSVTVRNLGSAAADGVTVKLRVPAGAAFAGDPSAGWTCDLGRLRCDFGTLAGGGEAPALTLPFSFPAQDAGTVGIVSATASTSSQETATANNTGKATVSYTAVADLSMDLLFAQTEVKAIEDAGMVFAPRLAALHRALGSRRAVAAGLAGFLALLASLPGRTAFVPASRALDVPQQ
jgi:hypothetical protein